MAELGLTWVRIGEFAWSRIEPEPGRFDWDWLDRAIGVLGKAGLKVVLGTPTATPPRWMLEKHPDMLAVDAEGRPVHPGDMAAQVRQAFDNLETVLRQAGLSLGDVVRLNYYVTDMAAFSAAGAEIGRRFAGTGRCPPSGTLLGVASLFHPALMIEMEATAAA